MEEIKVGEYGRTNLGRIFIFAWLEYAEGKIDESKVLLGDGKTFENEFYYFEKGEKIVKHSRNPIDLIKVGDYVNGHKILEIKQNAESGLRYLMYDYVPMKYYVERTDNIKSIVTKEQFLSVEYRLQEGDK